VTELSAEHGARSGIMKTAWWRNAGSSSCASDANLNYCSYFLSGPKTSRQFSSFLCIQANILNCTSWNSNKGRPTWRHLLYYVNLLLNMFRMLIHPSSGACDYLVLYCLGCIVLTWGVLVLCSGIGCWRCGIRVQAEPLLLLSSCWSTFIQISRWCTVQYA